MNALCTVQIEYGTITTQCHVCDYKPGFHPGGKGGEAPPPPPPPKKEERRKKEMWSLREAILFVGGVREREEKIIEEVYVLEE